MGYVIKEQIKKAQVTIPAANVATLDSNPYTIIPEVLGSPTNNYTIIAAQLSVNDINTNIAAFGHFYLQYDSSAKCAVYDSNNGVVQDGFRNNFIINMSHPPNTFGSITIQGLTRDLKISSELPPFSSTGNGELVVTVYYFDNF